MTIKEMLDMGADTLQKAGVADYRLDGWYLLSYYMGIGKNEYYLKMNEPADGKIREEYMRLIAKRADRIPLQYIIGEQEFFGLLFKVNESVLIPRQDTEVLVEHIIKYADNKRVLDMCTGSGCIAVSIAKCAAPKSVTAADISKGALDTAKENARLNGVDINFIQSDIWSSIEGKYDVIVSNPPYITEDEMKTLEPEVKDHEPHIALSGGKTGLVFYEKIIAGLDNYLEDGGIICFETGCTQAEAVGGLLADKGLSSISVIKDLAGLDRVVWGKR